MLAHLEKSWIRSLMEAYQQLQTEKGQDKTPVRQEDAERLANIIYTNALTTASIVLQSNDVRY